MVSKKAEFAAPNTPIDREFRGGDPADKQRAKLASPDVLLKNKHELLNAQKTLEDKTLSAQERHLWQLQVHQLELAVDAGEEVA